MCPARLFALRSAPFWGVLLFGFFLALGVELLWRRGGNRLPIYRRHLLIWLLVTVSLATLGVWRWGSIAPALPSACGSLLGLAMASLPFLQGRDLAGFGWTRGSLQRPDPRRPLILVADAHWSEELTGLREATLASPEADWLFLGDIFDLWVGLPGMETEAQRSFLWWVRERRHQGRWIGFWMGNREYALDRLAPQFDLLGEGVGGALPEEGLTWEHGDLINAQDWRYRLWNLISRSGFIWLPGRLLPATWVKAQLMKLEKGMRTINPDYKLQFPREAFRVAAREKPKSAFITGHFHTYEVEANGTSLPWAHEGRFMLWHEGRVQPFQ